ncbi:MAG: DNA polymerase III subunit beta [Clostridia bacterium]|nr:DNA polymerase III subunit beta [Clostridia bacterium]MBR6524141.1 DNA polymerase III subunit beta [Clostridia bacterium]
MKIICNKTTLNEAVISVSKAVSSHSNLPILEGIYINASSDGCVTLVSNDMEMGIEAKISAEVEAAGSTVLNAKILGSIVKNLPLEEVHIELNDKNICTIRSGNSKFEISGMSSLDFPELPIVNPDYSIKIGKKTLKEMISKTIFCASVSDNRPILKGCLFDIEGDTVRMVSTDGFRLAVRCYHLDENNGERKFVVPAKALGEINKILKDDDELVEVNCTSKNAVFIFENYKIVTRLIEGDYINYKSAIYDEGEFEIECPLYELFDSVYRASLIITENANDAPVKFLIEEDNINVSCETIVGKVDDNISVSTGGAQLEIGFFNEFLLGVLRACDDENVKIKFRKNINPMIITPIEGDEYVYLLLPRRLK